MISIVYGDSSLRSAEDKSFTKNRAIRFQRLMDSVGADSAVHSDTALDAALAPPVKIAHLVNVQTLPRAEFRKIEKFVADGGKLVAHGSMDPALAALFGLETPAQTNLETPAPGFTFIGKHPLNSPARVVNSVAMIYDTKPKPKSQAEIIALWDGTQNAAVINTPAGVWLTRVMMDDGERLAKAKLLVALSGHCHMEVWGVAARRLRAETQKTAELSKELRRHCPSAKRHTLDDIISALEHTERVIDLKFAAKTLAGAMPHLWRIRELTFKARAVATDLRLENKTVAVWISSPSALCGDDGWKPVATRLRAAGVNAAFVSIPALEWKPRDGSDALAPVFRAAGIKVHVWVQVGKTDPARRAELAKEKRLLLDAKGAALDWYDFADKRNVAEIIKNISELAARFKPDGIHLDYIRYPTDYGVVPRDAKCKATTALLRAIRASVKPPLLLTAAVYQNGEPNGVGQSWYEWMRDGLLDRAVPMNYTPTETKLAEICATQAKHAPASKLICGIGVNSYESSLDPAQTVKQAAAALSRKFAGVSFYHCDASFMSE
ncbi:MAG: hypothetical protein FWG05_04605, partial [Kiritimatiellaeota bacterium]|nr:hypothetical protein [Kiritimatiellota bacterium]